MEAFLVKLLEITPEEEIKLSKWAHPRCKKIKIIKEPYQTTFVGVLRSTTDIRRFRKTMRANTSNWGILHAPNDTWVDDITLAKYTMVFDSEQHKLDLLAVNHAIYDRIMREGQIQAVARERRRQGLIDGVRRVNRTDRVITHAIFNAFAEPVKKRKDQERKVIDQERKAIELINTNKRERFRAELDKLCICTCLPSDCSTYEDLEDIVQLREIVAQKRRRG
jgi:hypothetical protein